MNPDSSHWMKFAIGEAHRALQPGRRVGAALVSVHDQLMCSSFEGEVHGASWVRTLWRRVQENAIASAHSVYLTINTISVDGSFELTELLNDVRVDRVYIGLPDPAVTSYRDGDPAIERGPILRFPDDMQREIMEQNRDLYATSGQSIECNAHYSTHRISEAVTAKLLSMGFRLTKDDVNAHRGRAALASLISQRYGTEYKDADGAVGEALAAAFDTKYGTYDYAFDARTAAAGWADDFMSVYGRASSRPLSDVNVLNVGVGAGHEATALFSDCPRITFADIAESGLANISRCLPRSSSIVTSAEDLSALPDDSFDLYVSLRTYNSSFFDTSAAVREAHRVLKPGATIIVSVANGFLYTQRGCVVPGLIIPGTEFVDLYRGMDTANLIGTELECAGFEDVRMLPTSTEIYLSAVAA
ncbi:methyltransferase domain-containing protein [Streptomyces sp. NPDC059819]|uniref:class I SAM-dependent methyltransferase n=1 Tax=Streptomyces sp. NPDC059819 TaxID=3346963 RepID=UPI0036507888